MNFINDGELADKQESLLDKYVKNEKISENEIISLEKNMWVKTADFLSPCNLVIRHYCLIDLLRKCPKRSIGINNQLKNLAPYEIFLEGYSYWLYTKRFLSEYIKKFSDDLISYYIKRIDGNFLKTCYMVDDIRYPAPFGDLRHTPLEDFLQKDTSSISDEITLGTITKIKSKYIINPSIVGLNLHVPSNKKEYLVIDGKVIDKATNKEFKWYTGYKDKYPTKFHELKDLLRLKRLLSITNL
jgi:hypothetical protein